MKIRKKKYICFLAAALFLFFSHSGLYSSSSKNAGTTSANFLKIITAPRAEGMGGAFSSVADDFNCLTYNPAGIAAIDTPWLSFAYNKLYEDLQRGTMGCIYPVKFFTLGLSINSSYPDTLVRRDNKGNDMHDSFSVSDSIITVAGGKEINKDFSTGIGLKYIYQSIDDFTGWGLAVDLGVIYKLSFIPGLSSGAVIKNLGAGKNFNKLPIEPALGLNYKINERVMISSDVSFPIDSFVQCAFGLEYYVLRPIALRVGYKTSFQENTLGGVTGLKTGVGLNLCKNKILFDYCMTPFGSLSEGDFLKSNHQLAFTVIF